MYTVHIHEYLNRIYFDFIEKKCRYIVQFFFCIFDEIVIIKLGSCIVIIHNIIRFWTFSIVIILFLYTGEVKFFIVLKSMILITSVQDKNCRKKSKGFR